MTEAQAATRTRMTSQTQQPGLHVQAVVFGNANASPRCLRFTCPECGGDDMVHGVKRQTVSYGGLVSPFYDQPGNWCQNCGEGLISLKQMEAGNLELRKLKSLADQTDIVHPDAAA